MIGSFHFNHYDIIFHSLEIVFSRSSLLGNVSGKLNRRKDLRIERMIVERFDWSVTGGSHPLQVIIPAYYFYIMPRKVFSEMMNKLE